MKYNCFEYQPEMFAEDVRKLIYGKIKAKFANLIESQVTDDKKINACINIVSDLADGIASDIHKFVYDGLDNTTIKQSISCKNCKYEIGNCYNCSKFKLDEQQKEMIQKCKNENYKYWCPKGI